MANSFSLEIKNADAISAALAASPSIMQRYLDRALKASAITIFDKRESEVPKDTGQLSATMQWDSSRLSARIYPTKTYAEPVHEGSRPHVIEAKNAKVLFNKKTGQYFGKRVNHPGNKPNRFLVRMLDSSESAVQDYFEQALGLATRDIAAKAR
jgi:hypothetical protein